MTRRAKPVARRAETAVETAIETAAGAGDEGMEWHALSIMNAMAEGAILWGEGGVCLLCNARARQLLELSDEDLQPGASRDDFLTASVAMGSFSRDRLKTIQGGFKAGKAFSYDRTTPQGRELKSQVRPTGTGGFVETVADVSDVRVQELIVEKAKEKAEKAQAELSEKLDDLKLEKRELEAQRAELERTALVATHASDLVYITNPEGRIEWINRAFSHRTGYQIGDVSGKSPIDLLCGKDSAVEEIYKLSSGFRERRMTRAELQVYAQDGTSFWLKCELIPIFSPDGRNTHFISVGRDVTDRRAAWKKAEQARLFEQRKRQESHLLTDFNEWLQSCDTVEEMFEVVETFLGRLLPQCKGSVYVYADNRDALDGICSWNGGKLLKQLEPTQCWGLRRGRPYSYGENNIAFPCEHVADQYGDELPERYCCVPITAHGDTVGLMHSDIPIRDEDGQPLDEDEMRETQKLVNICAEQISLAIANLKLREQLRDQSIRDVLTGLYNRRFFLDTARREINRSMATGEPVSIISFDVDRFKLFNDTYGHDAGDNVLRTLSTVMKAMFVGREIPCRFGGEEFIVLIPECGKEGLALRAEQLRRAVEQRRVRYGNQTLGVTISIGTVTYPDDGEGLTELIKRADQALYKAKEGGRNQVVSAADVDPSELGDEDIEPENDRIQARVAPSG